LLLSSSHHTYRGQLDSSRDNAPLIKEILTLRLEQAQLHGYESYAAYATADSMAKTTESVMELLLKVINNKRSERDKAKGILLLLLLLMLLLLLREDTSPWRTD
jgi:Zn-dependent oligopeptidase